MPPPARRDEDFNEHDRELRISLKDYFEHRLTAFKESVDQRFEAIVDASDQRFGESKEQTGLARQELRERLEGMNEFRKTITDLIGNCVSKSEAKADSERIGKLELAKSNQDGRMWGVGLVIGVIVFLLNLAFAYFLSRMK